METKEMDVPGQMEGFNARLRGIESIIEKAMQRKNNLTLNFFLPYSKEARGTFGDQFGAVNALFSGLAFAGLIYTIILQRHDLKLQRRDLQYQRRDLELNRKELALNRKELKLTRLELELTRQEMEEQTAEFEKQNETLKIQRFENTFFNMLSQFQEVVNNLKVSKNFYGSEGRDCFEKTYAKNEQIEQSLNDFAHLSMYSIILRDGLNGYKGRKPQNILTITSGCSIEY